MNWRNPPPTVPPGIRRAAWVPPTIGTYYLRVNDRSVWQVADVFRRDQQVKLVPAVGGTPSYVFASQLLREFRQGGGVMIPIGVTYEEERDEGMILQALDAGLDVRAPRARSLTVEVVAGRALRTYRFTVTQGSIVERLATDAEIQFADKVQRLFAELAGS